MDEARPPFADTLKLVGAAAVAAHGLQHGFDMTGAAVAGTLLGALLVAAYLRANARAETPAATATSGLVNGLTVVIGLFCALPTGVAVVATVVLVHRWLKGQKAEGGPGGFASFEQKAQALLALQRQQAVERETMIAEGVSVRPAPPAPTPARKPAPAAPKAEPLPKAPEPERRPFEVPSATAHSTPSWGSGPLTSAIAPTATPLTMPTLSLEPSTLSLESRLPSSLGEGLGASKGVSGFEEALAMLQEKPRT